MYVLILTGLLSSCYDIDKPKKPKNLISKNEMSKILQDVYILNAAKGTNRSVLETNGIDPEKYILDKYGVDSLQFALSTEYYAFDIKSYEEIISTAKDRIQTAKDSLELEMERESERIKAEKDSLIKLRDTLKTESIDTISAKIGKPFN